MSDSDRANWPKSARRMKPRQRLNESMEANRRDRADDRGQKQQWPLSKSPHPLCWQLHYARPRKPLARVQEAFRTAVPGSTIGRQNPPVIAQANPTILPVNRAQFEVVCERPPVFGDRRSEHPELFE